MTRTLFLFLTIWGTAAVAADPEALAKEAGCGSCHLAEQKMLGPSWAAIAERYAGDDGAVDAIGQRLRAGSQGEWGSVPMAPVTPDTLSDDDLDAVIRWVLEH
jgi:cytochrome c